MGINLDAGGAHPGPMGNLSPRAPNLSQPTPSLGWSGGAVLIRVVAALLLSYCSAGPWVAACGTTPLLTPFSFFPKGGGSAFMRLVCLSAPSALSCLWRTRSVSLAAVGHHKKNKNLGLSESLCGV